MAEVTMVFQQWVRGKEDTLSNDKEPSRGRFQS